MMRSLYSAISGLKAHQTDMDVIGNNIANVNTVGFKRSSVSFATALSQMMQGATTPNSAGTPATGGSNPIQVGLGTSIGAINQDMSSGSSENTGNSQNMMIQGSGFFALQDGSQTVYTRAGAFTTDGEGYLVDPATGAYVMTIPPGTAPTSVPTSPPTATISGVATQGVWVDPATYPGGYSVDANGVVSGKKADGTTEELGTIVIAKFANDSGLNNIGNNYYTPSNNSGTGTGSTSTNPIVYGGTSTPYPTGTSLVTGYLEMSNVDLSQEMTNMITAQRGFQANSRVITVSDTLLQELIDLKRQ